MLLSDFQLVDLKPYNGRRRDIIKGTESQFSNVKNKLLLTPFIIEANSVQPVDGNTLQNIDEGLRNRAKYQFYTTTPIRNVDRKTQDEAFLSDQIEIDGEWFSVYAVKDWTRTSFLIHDHCVAIKEDAQEIKGYQIEIVEEGAETTPMPFSLTQAVPLEGEVLEPLPNPFPEFPDVTQKQIDTVRMYLMYPDQSVIPDFFIAQRLDFWLPRFPDKEATAIYNTVIDCLRWLVFQTKGKTATGSTRREKVGNVEVEVRHSDQFESNWEWLLDQYLKGLIPIEGSTKFTGAPIYIGGVNRQEVDRVRNNPSSVNGLFGFSTTSRTNFGYDERDPRNLRDPTRLGMWGRRR